MSQPPKKKSAPGAAPAGPAAPGASKADRAAADAAATPAPVRAPAPVPNAPIPTASPPPADPLGAAEVYELQPRPPIRETPVVRPRPVPPPKPVSAAAPASALRANPVVLAFAGGIAAASLLAAIAWIAFGRGGGSAERRDEHTPPQAAKTRPAKPAASNADDAPTADLPNGDPSKGADSKSAVAKGDAAQEKEAAVAPRAAEAPVASAAKSAPAQATLTKAAPGSAAFPVAATASPGDVRRGLYTVLVRNADKSRSFRLGTACGVAPRCLVTSAAVIMAIEELQQEGLKVVVSPAGAMQEIRVIGIRVHPVYRQAVKTADSIRKEIARPAPAPAPVPPGTLPPNTIARPPNFPPMPSPGDRLNFEQARQMDFDIGVLELKEPREGHLPSFVNGPLAAAPDERFVVMGLPFKTDEPLLTDLSATSEPEQRTGNEVTSPAGRPVQFARMLNLADNLEGQNWSGSPVLNRANWVVGVYSRAVPGVDGSPGDRPAHAAVQVFLLRDFAADLLK